ncbi:MAG: nuclear transport factor 2 family protein [Dehalococcoidia bacterium]|nr:nuclear transport factor 2 family protein [Dehalococcoidia bacterium]
MDEIIALQDRRIEAMLKSDAKTLEDIMADDLVYTHTTARLDTKTSFIDAVKSGKAIYHSLELSAREVQNLGDTAVVTGHGKFHVGNNKFELRFIDVYAKRNNAWQMVAWQSTRLPD